MAVNCLLKNYPILTNQIEKILNLKIINNENIQLPLQQAK